ncbi:MAG: ankyrin repeat domain-containing protein [bacterium]
MKYIKTYNQLNEGLRDKMTGISEDETAEILRGLTPFAKMQAIEKYDLDSKYYPSDYEIKHHLKRFNIDNRVHFIKYHKLDSKFLPTIEDLKNNIITQDKTRYNLLKLAIEHNNLELARFLIKHHTLDPNHIYAIGFDSPPIRGITLLHVALNKENKEAFEFLLKHGADPHLMVDGGNVYSDIYREVQHNYKPRKIHVELLELMDKYSKTNESLRDKMKPKTDAEIEDAIKNLSEEELEDKFIALWYKYRNRFTNNHFERFFSFIESVIDRNLWHETIRDYINRGYEDDIRLEYLIRFDETEETILRDANLGKEKLHKLIKELLEKFKES